MTYIHCQSQNTRPQDDVWYPWYSKDRATCVKNILGLLTVPLTPSKAPATCMACAHVEKLSGISGLTSQVLCITVILTAPGNTMQVRLGASVTGRQVTLTSPGAAVGISTVTGDCGM